MGTTPDPTCPPSPSHGETPASRKLPQTHGTAASAPPLHAPLPLSHLVHGDARLTGLMGWTGTGEGQWPYTLIPALPHPLGPCPVSPLLHGHPSACHAAAMPGPAAPGSVPVAGGPSERLVPAGPSREDVRGGGQALRCPGAGSRGGTISPGTPALGLEGWGRVPPRGAEPRCHPRVPGGARARRRGPGAAPGEKRTARPEYLGRKELREKRGGARVGLPEQPDLLVSRIEG